MAKSSTNAKTKTKTKFGRIKTSLPLFFVSKPSPFFPFPSKPSLMDERLEEHLSTKWIMELKTKVVHIKIATSDLKTTWFVIHFWVLIWLNHAGKFSNLFSPFDSHQRLAPAPMRLYCTRPGTRVITHTYIYYSFWKFRTMSLFDQWPWRKSEETELRLGFWSRRLRTPRIRRSILDSSRPSNRLYDILIQSSESPLKLSWNLWSATILRFLVFLFFFFFPSEFQF